MVDAHLQQWMEGLARDSGNVLQSFFGKEGLVVNEKTGPHDLVTEADHAAEKVVLERIRHDFPDDTILSEESGPSGDSENAEYIWVIDPLDGTNNFARGVAQFGTMIVRARNVFACDNEAARLDGRYPYEPEAAVIYMPMDDRMYFAQRGEGAYRNGDRMQLAALPAAESDRTIAMGVIQHFEGASTVSAFRELCKTETSMTLEAFHSAAFSITALLDGAIQGYYMNDLYAWDVAPMILLAQEAGYSVARFNGAALPWWSPAGTDTYVHPELIPILQPLIDRALQQL